MNKLSLVLSLALAVLFFSGCASIEEKYAKKVNCAKEDVKVDRTVNAPGYQQYKVTCKNVTYSCKVAPFTDRCDIDDSPDGKKTTK